MQLIYIIVGVGGEVRRFLLVTKVKLHPVFFISGSKQTNIRDFQLK